MSNYKGKMETGTSWARLRCVKAEVVTIQIRDGDGRPFDSYDEAQYDFECDCGKKFSMSADVWPGKRKMKDCGCGISVDDGVIVVYNFTGPLHLRREIEKYQKSRGLSFSRACVEVMREGVRGLAVGTEAI